MKCNQMARCVGRLLLGVIVASWAELVAAQVSSRPARVAFLGAGSELMYSKRVEAFRRGLQEHGYIEGKSISIEFEYGDGKYENLLSLARKLVAHKPDVIVASATPAIRAVQQATNNIPIVMAPATDPIGSGFVKSLSRPGGNITGVANMSLDISAKALELLHTVVPKATRVAVLMTNNPSHLAQLDEIQTAATKLGLTLVPLKVANADQIGAAFATMSKSECQALLVVADPMLISQAREIAENANSARLPAVYQAKEHVDAGGLMSYGADLPALTNVASDYVDRVLKGALPGELPIEQPSRLEMAVNMNTAKALGIEIPASILVGSEVIE